MKPADYEYCARKIVGALQLTAGESVLLKVDPRVFTPIIEPLQKRIRTAGAHILGAILSEDSATESAGEFDSLRELFSKADVFVWLPELHQSSPPALARAIAEW